MIEKETKNEYVVNDTNGIWLCPLVLKGNQECRYGLCSNCYGEKAPVKRRRVKDKCASLNGLKCNHKLITSFTNFFDSTYFTAQYKQKYDFVKECGKCGLNFVA